MNMRSVWLGLAGALAALSCMDAGTKPPEPTLAIDFEVGSVAGTVSWSGAPVAGSNPGFQVGPQGGPPAAYVDSTGHYVIDSLPVGDVNLEVGACGVVDLGTASATVVAGATVPANFDVTAALGRVVGTTTVNGVPTSMSVSIGSCPVVHSQPDGTFAALVLPGTHQARLFKGVETFTAPFVVTAGATIDVGTLNVAHGALIGEVKWHLNTAFDVRAMRFAVRLDHIPLTPFIGSGYLVPAVTVGEHALDLYTSACRENLHETTVTAIEGAETVTDFDVTAQLGRLRGRLTVGGQALSGSQIRTSLGGCNFIILVDGAGAFSDLLPPGDYSATISRGVDIGTTTFTVVAGQVVDVGTIDVPVGTIAGTVSWNGLPLTSADAGGFGVSTADGFRSGVDGSGHYAIPSVPPGSYDIAVDSNCGGDRIGATTIAVTSNATTTANFELGSVMGRFTGVVAGPTPSNVFVRIDPCFGVGVSPGQPYVSPLLAAGTYTVTVGSGSLVTTFPVTIVAGQTVDVGTARLASGAVEVATSWKGTAVTPVDAAGLSVDIDELWRAEFSGGGRFVAPFVPPGDHTLRLYNRCRGLLAESAVTVVDGATATVSRDLSTFAGQIKGRISLNGTPFSNRVVTLDRGGVPALPFIETEPDAPELLAAVPLFTCDLPTDAGGAFSSFLLPDDEYQASFRSSAFVGMFSFAIVSNQQTNIDGTTTPADTNVTIDLLGGVATTGGISITFPLVNTVGHTTVVSSGVGPPPPTGYQILGFLGQPHYWDIDTSADYDGTLTVCIHYDQAWITGNEDMLRLVHDAGSGLVNITTTRNPAANIVCGITNSLSPFAIVEPTGDTAGPVFSKVPATIIAYAPETKGVKVNYKKPVATDAIDGDRPVTCVPASGSTFKPNTTLVTCTAADTRGNPTTASFTVWVQYHAPADGSFFLKPIRANGRSIFRIGRPVPVRFKLTGPSAGITNLAATLVVNKISDAIQGTVEDTSDETVDDADLQFRYRAVLKAYAYRWRTSDQTQGTYRLRAELGDGISHEVNVSLKRAR